MKDKRVSGSNGGGSRRHGDPPAWLDDTLPLEERRRLLDVAIRAVAASPPRAVQPSRPAPGHALNVPGDPRKVVER